MIGVFDSGLGGVAIARSIRATFPNVRVLLRTDRTHAPYGERTPIDVLRLASPHLRALDDAGCSTIVIACNTLTSAMHTYAALVPPLRAHVLHLVDSVAPVLAACGARITVLATRATVAAHLYANAIGARVSEIAVPAFVPLLESGASRRSLQRAVARIGAELPRATDVLVYGCTHFPLLDRYFATLLGDVRRIDPASFLLHTLHAQACTKGNTPC